ncbi:hypothetical protein ACJZ2D_012636 [Fusarium nematophilum]
MSRPSLAPTALKRVRQEETGEHERVIKRRSSVACQAYRTWEQILDCKQRVPANATTETPYQGASPHPSSDPSPSRQEEGFERGDSPEPQTPGTITPLDPHNLMKSFDQDLHGNSSRFTRRLFRFLGEQFPVGHGRESHYVNETPGGFHDLLPSITKIAKQGWALDERDKARRIRRVTSLPTTELLPEDARLLEHWTPQALQEVVSEMTRYFEYGLRGSKRDVARDLDPLQRGMITEPRAQELFEAFFRMVHPQWAMLDPSIHTLDFVRQQSALLTTAILALGSIALATLAEGTDDQVAEALKLRAHTEKLSLVVYSTGARSLEIVQAQVLLSRFGGSSKTRLDEQRWLRSAMIPRMAAEIGLASSAARSHCEDSLDQAANDHRWNDLRTRAFMILNEYRFFTFSGRAPLDMSYFELQEADIDCISALGADHPSSSLPALYHLYLFQKEVRRRLDLAASTASSAILQLEADLAWVMDHTEKWIARWCDGNSSPGTRWHLLHDALSCQLLLSARIIGWLPQTDEQADYKKRLLDISIRIFQEALDAAQGTHMTHRASIFPFAGALILRFSDRRDLVLRLALRMAGRPGKQYVPTFIRNAGNQLLAMLCANHSQSRPSMPVARESASMPRDGTERGPMNEVCQSQHNLSPPSNDLSTSTHQTNGPRPDSRCDPGSDLGPRLNSAPQEHDLEIGQPNEVLPGQSQERVSQPEEFQIETTEPQQPAQQPGAEDYAINMAVRVSQEQVSIPQEQFYPNAVPQANPGEIFSLDTSWDFPCVPTILSPQAPLFTSHELISDFETLMGGRLAGSYRDVGQQQEEFSFMPPVDTNPSIQQYLGVCGDSMCNPSASEYSCLVPGGGDIGAAQPRFESASRQWDEYSPVNATSTTASGDVQQTPRDRQEYRQTLFQTIGRLLEMASTS